ncbi:hypothetical protein DTO027B5_5228 [Paecilomyces variotii]|nr:hypothetical protein DTO027B3_2814 [Paecilomyces variotii]KAJ9332975.1 hypothetical protein DTO027B5_5228 [Paecilomyces variotii]
MAQQTKSLRDQVSQLEAARNLVLGDAAFYPQIVNGILPIIGATAQLELRRWGAEFLAETFASPALAAAQKEQLAGPVVQTLKEILELPEEDIAVVKYVVQAAASLYPIVFRHIINHPEDAAMWEKMTALKQIILRRWDSAPYPVKVCCIKFVQRVVHVQTAGPISDPRRPDKNETSLAIVPRNHAILSLPNLEAESSGLLDRLLMVLQEDSSDAVLVNATLNCLAVLIRTRQSIAAKIIDSVLTFDPVKHINGSMSPTLRVNLKSMERTARALLINVMKRNPNHPLALKMQQYIDRLSQSRLDVFDETSRKRGLPAEPTDGLDNTKRAKLGADTPPIFKIPPLPPGQISYAQLYTLTEDVGLSTFDVKQLPIDLIVKITVPVLGRVDQGALTQAIEAVRSRYQTLSSRQQATQQQAAVEEEDDDYEPEYSPMDVPDNAIGETQTTSTEVAEMQPDLVSLGPFVLPRPPPLTEDEAKEIGKSTAERVFSMVTSMDAPRKTAKGSSQQQLGFSRLAGSTFDRDAWVTLLTRLATRASGGLESEEDNIKTEEGVPPKKPTISDSIRELLYRYILEDFRSRINVGITWLNEEWYNDRIQLKFAGSQRLEDSDEVYVPLHYDRWVLRLLDGILPYVDARDKILIRFLSEIPEINTAIIERVKSLARDPERVNLCVQALLYLVMFRPPAREVCLDALEDIYRTYEESRPVAGKFLIKWRPHVVEPQQAQPVKPLQQTEGHTSSNGETPAVQQPQQEMNTAAG